MTKNQEIQGFKVLKLRFSSNNTSCHDIFVKEHTSRQQSAETPKERTLFVLNIPPYATEESLKQAFSQAGIVQDVIFKHQNVEENLNGFKIGYIVFKNALHLQKALTLTNLELLSVDDSPILTGIKKWTLAYNNSIKSPETLQTEINEFMERFDKQENENKKQEQIAGEEDGDGWITVTKRGRNPGVSRKEAVEQKIKEKMEKTQKKKELKNFYTFQIRESKMKHLANLRQKFEEDKKKITALKQARKFKPF